jgi:hypothetical protein
MLLLSQIIYIALKSEMIGDFKFTLPIKKERKFDEMQMSK